MAMEKTVLWTGADALKKVRAHEIDGYFGQRPAIFGTAESPATGSALEAGGLWDAARHAVAKLGDDFEAFETNDLLTPKAADDKKTKALENATLSLEGVADKRDVLQRTFNTLVGNAKEKVKEAVDPQVNIALWKELPSDAHQLGIVYRAAVDRKDWATCDAIESRPGLFEGQADLVGNNPDENIDSMEDLKLNRMVVEAPETLEKIDKARQVFDLVDSAVNAAELYIAEKVQALSPDAPEPEFTVVESAL